jgi:hypothetical protein
MAKAISNQELWSERGQEEIIVEMEMTGHMLRRGK